MGKASINIDTYGKSTGNSKSYSTNYQLGGRELLTPDEVRMLDNKYAIVFIRGERPIKDFKYEIMKHPNVKYTADGKAKPYIHGNTSSEVASITIHQDNGFFNYSDFESELENYEIIFSEDIDEYLKKEELDI